MAKEIQFERLLKACFKPHEWTKLSADSRFMQGVGEMKTHEQFEEVVLYGERLLQKLKASEYKQR